jgi:[ribosomal protein S5]-alanine N-acetyltransferase
MLPADVAELQTERLVVRLARHSDLPALLDINGDEQITRHLPYDTWRDMADAQAWFDRATARHQAGDGRQFVIALRDTGQVIGACLLFRYDQANGRAEIGYLLGRRWWGAGYAQEATAALIRYAFEELGLRRVEADIDPRNLDSARLLERLGFSPEGVLRQRWNVKGRTSDAAIYGLLREEWTAQADGRE